MELIDLLLDQDNEPLAETGCPVCGGALILLRDYFRCSRCRHSFCESCEVDWSESEA